MKRAFVLKGCRISRVPSPQRLLRKIRQELCALESQVGKLRQRVATVPEVIQLMNSRLGRGLGLWPVSAGPTTAFQDPASQGCSTLPSQPLIGSHLWVY